MTMEFLNMWVSEKIDQPGDHGSNFEQPLLCPIFLWATTKTHSLTSCNHSIHFYSFQKKALFSCICSQKHQNDANRFHKNKSLNGQKLPKHRILHPLVELGVFNIAKTEDPELTTFGASSHHPISWFHWETFGAFWEKTSSNKQNMDNVSIQNSNDNFFFQAWKK